MIIYPHSVDFPITAEIAGNTITFKDAMIVVEVLRAKGEDAQGALIVTNGCVLADNRDIPVKGIWSVEESQKLGDREFFTLRFHGAEFAKQLVVESQTRAMRLRQALEARDINTIPEGPERTMVQELQDVLKENNENDDVFTNALVAKASGHRHEASMLVERILAISRDGAMSRMFKAFLEAQPIALRLVVEDGVSDGVDKDGRNVNELIVNVLLSGEQFSPRFTRQETRTRTA